MIEEGVEADESGFLAAVLASVESDGKVFNLTQGYRRVEEADATRPLGIGMRAVSAMGAGDISAPRPVCYLIRAQPTVAASIARIRCRSG